MDALYEGTYEVRDGIFYPLPPSPPPIDYVEPDDIGMLDQVVPYGLPADFRLVNQILNEQRLALQNPSIEAEDDEEDEAEVDREDDITDFADMDDDVMMRERIEEVDMYNLP